MWKAYEVWTVKRLPDFKIKEYNDEYKKYITSLQYNTMIFVECGGKLLAEIGVKPLAIYSSLNARLKRDSLIYATD